MKGELEKIGMKNDGISKRIDLLNESLQTNADGSQQKLETLLEACREAQDIVMEKQILQALVFTDMDARFISIHQAERDTFRWILENPHDLLEKEPALIISFTDWLRSGSGIFHIVGKPGAGKSSLMKYLCEHQTTRYLLEEWAAASGRQLLFCKFFFWRVTPVPEQKTLKGLMRGLLHGVLTRVPSLSRRLFPRLWDAKRGASQWGSVELSDSDFSDAFESLIGDMALFDDFRLCFFIDGLDEFEQTIAIQNDTHASLAATLRRWTSNSGGSVKICVSSRPLPEFLKSFPVSQRLTLQKLTEGDIRTLVTRRLHSNVYFAQLRSRSKDERSRCDQLEKKILCDAEGVFLWVVLVLNELEQAMANSDSLEVLEKIVVTSHTDIKKFVRGILLSIPNRYRLGSYYLLAVVLRMLGMFTSEIEATAHLRAALQGAVNLYRGMGVHHISLAECAMLFDAADRGRLLDCDEKLAEITLDPTEQPEATAIETDRLITRCRGLVEVDPKMRIRFAHRAIPEALQEIFFSKTLEEPIQESCVTELLAWIALANIGSHRRKGTHLNDGVSLVRLNYLALTHFRIYNVPLHTSRRMLRLLSSIHDAIFQIQHHTVTPDDNPRHALGWPENQKLVIHQCLDLCVYDFFQLHEFHCWFIENRLSPERNKGRLLGYLRLIVLLLGGDLPWISSTALEALLSKMLQCGLTIVPGHPPGFVHSTRCWEPECRLWHEFVFKDLVQGMTHKSMKGFRGYKKLDSLPKPINWKGLEVLLRFGADPDVYFSTGKTPVRAALLGADGEVLLEDYCGNRHDLVPTLVEGSLAEAVRLYKPPNMAQLLELIEQNMERKKNCSAQALGEAGQRGFAKWLGIWGLKTIAYISLAAWLAALCGWFFLFFWGGGLA